MSLTYNQIESHLHDGIYFSSGQREYVAKSDVNDLVTFRDMDQLWYDHIPLEVVVDRAHANEQGSDLGDVSALKGLLSTIAVGLRGEHPR